MRGHTGSRSPSRSARWSRSSTAACSRGRSACRRRRCSLPPLPDFPQLVLPLAISFFTFEFVHYIVDARAGKLPEHAASDFFAFVLVLPDDGRRADQAIPGLSAADRARQAGSQEVNDGITRIVIGLAKKVVHRRHADAAHAAPAATGRDARGDAEQLAVALVAFALKIYMDFSGYSDIAIGSARLFGLHVPENFNWPYIRANIAQFWRHWHMSLTSWITDYVYIPLGGSRRGLARTASTDHRDGGLGPVARLGSGTSWCGGSTTALCSRSTASGPCWPSAPSSRDSRVWSPARQAWSSKWPARPWAYV